MLVLCQPKIKTRTHNFCALGVMWTSSSLAALPFFLHTQRRQSLPSIVRISQLDLSGFGSSRLAYHMRMHAILDQALLAQETMLDIQAGVPVAMHEPLLTALAALGGFTPIEIVSRSEHLVAFLIQPHLHRRVIHLMLAFVAKLRSAIFVASNHQESARQHTLHLRQRARRIAGQRRVEFAVAEQKRHPNRPPERESSTCSLIQRFARVDGRSCFWKCLPPGARRGGSCTRLR